MGSALCKTAFGNFYSFGWPAALLLSRRFYAPIWRLVIELQRDFPLHILTPEKVSKDGGWHKERPLVEL